MSEIFIIIFIIINGEDYEEAEYRWGVGEVGCKLDFSGFASWSSLAALNCLTKLQKSNYKDKPTFKLQVWHMNICAHTVNPSATLA